MSGSNNINQYQEVTVEVLSEDTGLDSQMASLRQQTTQSTEVQAEGKNRLLRELSEEKDSHLKEFKDLAGSRWDDNRNVVRAYIADLEERNDAKSHFLLEKAFLGGVRPTQALVCAALSRMGSEGQRILIRHLVLSNGRFHPEVYRSLRQLGKKIVPELLQYVLGPSSGELGDDARLSLIRFMGEVKSHRIAKTLVDFLCSQMKNVRDQALESLRRQGPYAEAALLIFLNDEKPLMTPLRRQAEKNAIYLLGMLKSRKAMGFLLKRLHEDLEDPLFSIVVWALGEIGDPVCYDSMVHLLRAKEDGWLLRKMLIESIGKLRVMSSVEVLAPYLEDRELREAVLIALGRSGNEDALPWIVPFLEDPVRSLRCRAVMALGELGTKDAILYLMEGLFDVDPWVSRQAEKTLRQLYRPEEVEEIFARIQYDPQKAVASSIQDAREEAWSNLTQSDHEASPAESALEPADLPAEPEVQMDRLAKSKSFGGFMDKVRAKADEAFRKLEASTRPRAARGQNPWDFPSADFGSGDFGQGPFGSI